MTESGAALVACLSMEHITTGLDSRVNAEKHFPSVGNCQASVVRRVMASEHADTSTELVLERKGQGSGTKGANPEWVEGQSGCGCLP